MSRFVEGVDRAQASFLPACLEDFVDEDNPARTIDAFVEALDLTRSAFEAKPRPLAGRAIILQRCCACTFTVTSTVSSQVGGSSASATAMSS